MYVRAGRPDFSRPCVGVHKSTSPMSSSLLLQQCPACLVRLTWIVFVIGGRVNKFTYLGSSVASTEKDIDTRLTKAWTAMNRLSIIWKSDLIDKMKHSFFQAVVESILLYGCTTWTITKRLETKLDGNCTRMLRAILNKSWRQHPTRHQLCGHLLPIYIYIYIYIYIFNHQHHRNLNLHGITNSSKIEKNIINDKNNSTHIKSDVGVYSNPCLGCNWKYRSKTSQSVRKWI